VLGSGAEPKARKGGQREEKSEGKRGKGKVSGGEQTSKGSEGNLERKKRSSKKKDSPGLFRGEWKIPRRGGGGGEKQTVKIPCIGKLIRKKRRESVAVSGENP